MQHFYHQNVSKYLNSFFFAQNLQIIPVHIIRVLCRISKLCTVGSNLHKVLLHIIQYGVTNLIRGILSGKVRLKPNYFLISEVQKQEQKLLGKYEIQMQCIMSCVFVSFNSVPINEQEFLCPILSVYLNSFQHSYHHTYRLIRTR